jgi:hypothetical protein
MSTALNRTTGGAESLPDALCGGAIHRRGDAGYDRARQAWNLVADLRPAAIAYPRSIAELAEVVTAAREAGLRIAAEGTGHAAGTLGTDLDDVLLVKTSAMTGVQVDAEALRVRVQAGALWDDVVRAVEPHGITVLHGSSPDVGVVGYTLGGGLGWYARALGLAAHSVTAATVVTSSGEIVRTDEHNDPELLWALRGGAGGNFAVVAELEFKAYPFATAYAGMLIWDLERAPEVLATWQRWTESAPDCVTTSLRFLRIPPIPEMPEAIRGRSLVVIDGAVIADGISFDSPFATDAEQEDAARRVLAPLRALQPEVDTFATVPTSTLPRLHMDPEGPTGVVSASSLLTELDDKAQSALLDVAGPQVQSPLIVVEIRQLGGVLARPSVVPAALEGFSAQYALFACAVTPVPEAVAPGQAAAHAVVEAMAAWAGGHYLNFAEERVEVEQAFPTSTWEKLRALRFVWDPDEALLASHPIPPVRPSFLAR